MITVSIVSHGHGGMISSLIDQLHRCPEVSQIVLTLNIPEKMVLPYSEKVLLIHNDTPKGFGANHNFAFTKLTQDYFCVLNPDIELLNNPFNPLMNMLMKDKTSGIVAPAIMNSLGKLEDSARYFPTLISLLKKFLFNDEGKFPIKDNELPAYPEWVAGMFMLFSRNSFSVVGGFDERYFLYYEDVDICRRLKNHGYVIALLPFVHVIHMAQRASRKNLYHMRLHISSALRFLSSTFFDSASSLVNLNK
jgi:N-acetylglucosaminyl-diphospho-decaprenol L-rhamnosyltransferase